MKQFVLLTSILMSTLAANPADAQFINEIIRGTVLDVPSDVFACNNGISPCNLSYRMYSEVDITEVNGPRNPVDGIPGYFSTTARPQQYLADAQITGNFPNGGNSGAGNEWYIVWDGITGSGTADHAGWYGGQSQIINNGEIGNSASANCLPVIAAEACFAALSAGSSSGTSTTRADGSSLSPIGGIAPISCPTINGLSLDAPGYIDVSWGAATNYTARDGAGSPITGYKLLWITNPASAPTDIDWATVSESASFSSTSGKLNLAGLGLAQGGSITVAIRLQYAGGLESTQVSCNSNNYVVQSAPPKAVPTMSTYVLIFTILGLIAVASGGLFRRKFTDG